MIQGLSRAPILYRAVASFNTFLDNCKGGHIKYISYSDYLKHCKYTTSLRMT